MKKSFAVFIGVVALTPLLGLFQNMTILPPNYDLCLATMGTNYEWSNEVEVPVDGFSEHMMEPKFSNDQGVLFFNDKPADGNMNLHYAIRQPSGRYQYAGLLRGTVSGYLDGVPVLDAYNRFYFTSNRNYLQTSGTIYGGQLGLGPNGLQLNFAVSSDQFLPRKAAGEMDMDIDISYDGKTAISSRAIFSNNKPYPDYGKLRGFNMSNFLMSSNPYLDLLLNFVNRKECVVYAPNLSINQLELYYSFYEQGKVPTGNSFYVAVSKRASVNHAFGQGKVISAIKGLITEAPSLTINDGQKNLIYHKIDPVSGKFKIYKVSRN